MSNCSAQVFNSDFISLIMKSKVTVKIIKVSSDDSAC